MNATTRHEQGFTLIELLVVLVMIGIMMAIAVPSFASFISNYRATGAVNELLQSIVVTRAEALKRGKRVTMWPLTTAGVPSLAGAWSNGWMIFVDTNNSGGWNAADEVVMQHPKLPSSTVTAAVGSYTTAFSNANYVSFDGTGYPKLASGAILSGGISVTDTVGSSINIRTLCLAVLGRPRIVKGVDTCASG